MKNRTLRRLARAYAAQLPAAAEAAYGSAVFCGGLLVATVGLEIARQAGVL